MPNDLYSLNRAVKVSPAGRILSGIAGILLTSTALTGKRRQPLKAILGGYLLFRGASGYCPVSQALNRPSGASAVEVLTSLTVNKPLDETYRFWRNLKGLPVFMKHLESVIELENKQSLWVAALPWKMGKLQWKAEITTEKINECIAWRALENADIAHHGSVHFKDAGKFGTEVRVERLNYEETDIREALKEMTGGRGPDVCIDAVGMEANSTGVEEVYDKVKQAVRLQTDRTSALRQAIMACRKGGTLSIIGVYSGLVDKFPLGPLVIKGLNVKTGMVHAQKYIPVLLEHIRKGELDPTFLKTQEWTLEQGQEGYKKFAKDRDNVLRGVFAL